MSIAGNPGNPSAGSSDVPAEGVPAQGNQVPPRNTDAAMSPDGSPEGAGTPDGVDQPGADIDDETLVRLARERGYFTRDDFNRATSTLMQQKNEASRQARQAAEQLQAKEAEAQLVRQLATEHGVDEEELENALLKFNAEQQQSQQSQQEEAQQTATAYEQMGLRQVQSWIRDFAFDDTGGQLFDPNDREVLSAAHNYVQWMKQYPFSPEEAEANVEGWARHIRQLLKSRLMSANHPQAQAEPEQPEQAPQQNQRGRQVTAARGGGGQPGMREQWEQALQSGDDHDEAFMKALRATLTTAS